MKKQFCLILPCILLLVLSAVAQIQNGQFAGTVTDPSGAAIPNAKISIVNLGTNLSATATTNATGAYTIKELPIGAYKITVQATGFKTVSNSNVQIEAGTTAHVDFRMELGRTEEVVEVSGEASAVNTEEAKLATTITTAQISNLPLNGHNVYDLMQLSPGAVNVAGVDFEAGHNTVVNGLREDFNGFLINGVANKGLSGGVNNTPIQDTVQEFQQLELNVSAQYGNSAGSINNLVTKSGTNAFHGTVWEYFRNDKLDANEYFLNQQDVAKPPLRFNQFGATLGGPIVKDKLFFFGSYQGDRFTTSGTPQTITVESPEWRSAVEAAQPNSVASLLYHDFSPSVAGSTLSTLDQYVPTASYTDAIAGVTSGVTPDYSGWLCADNNSALISSRIASVIGVTAVDQAIMMHNNCAAGSIPAIQAGTMARTDPFINSSVAIFKSQTQSLGNLFNGNEASARLDYNWDASNRMYAQVNWLKTSDQFGPCNSACTRGFSNPAKYSYPNGQFNYVHTFSPTVLNEFKVGYTQNNLGISVNHPGVPDIYFDDGTAGFGSYSGYPQFFKEHDYSYGDMVSISHGNHNIKIGVDIKRNLENSEFNVARPSYEMFDPLYFAADSPAEQVAGVDPGFADNTAAHLDSNVRHWRNLEFGSYFQDDWKVSKRLTLNLGMRYDLFTRHSEENNLATTFKLGPGSSLSQQIASANVPFSTATDSSGNYLSTCNPSTVSVLSSQVLAGVCGDGGFAASKGLGAGDHNDFGPRVGFAWDVFGNGKTSLRGGFGVSYESTLYNPLSNSRWNPPYYSFNLATGPLNGGGETLIYGPTTCTATSCSPSGATPTYSGAGTNPNQGTGAQSAGNITGWAAFNPDTAYLTGIVLPQGIRDPYVYNYFFSLQHEIAPKLVVEADYVGTTGHKLFRAEDPNREAGGLLPSGDCVTDNLGRDLCSLKTTINPSGRPNSNYATLRTWENAVNSNYNALQLSAKKQMSHGLLFNVSYTYSHSIDEGSTWHSGATTASGGSGGDGYATDDALPGLDRGNSVFDIRHRLVVNYVYELPGQHLRGVEGAVLGGWQYNGIWAFQSGAHWSPYDSRSAHLTGNSDPTNGPLSGCYAVPFVAADCSNTGGDYNLDAGKNDRPDSSIPQFSQSRSSWANGWCPDGTNNGGILNGCAPSSASTAGLPVISTPCLACTGNLGRNQFEGPGQWYSDMTLGKVFKFTERVNMKFEWSLFNVFNRANFLLATTGGGANNHVSFTNFGQAAGTLNARNMQFGLKLLF
ncbi:MAG TPA: TonB-dependent receptor [Terriglobales bacterium]|nr:TonB-dependent receptor [Terriglobales bacterium]